MKKIQATPEQVEQARKVYEAVSENDSFMKRANQWGHSLMDTLGSATADYTPEDTEALSTLPRVLASALRSRLDDELCLAALCVAVAGIATSDGVGGKLPLEMVEHRIDLFSLNLRKLIPVLLDRGTPTQVSQTTN